MARLSVDQKAVVLSLREDVKELYEIGQKIDADLARASERLSSLKQELGGGNGAMGLTPDAIKMNPECKAAKAEVDRLFKRVQDFADQTKDFHRAFQVIRRPERYAHVVI